MPCVTSASCSAFELLTTRKPGPLFPPLNAARAQVAKRRNRPVSPSTTTAQTALAHHRCTRGILHHGHTRGILLEHLFTHVVFMHVHQVQTGQPAVRAGATRTRLTCHETLPMVTMHNGTRVRVCYTATAADTRHYQAWQTAAHTRLKP